MIYKQNITNDVTLKNHLKTTFAPPFPLKKNQILSLTHTHTHTHTLLLVVAAERLNSYFGSLLALECLIRIIFRVSATEDSKLFHPANQQLNRLQIQEHKSCFK
ncbi:hypothetical protein L2E82_25372 [Cichorium intybus]|uniref:Uncharacterized protein n=1 Tax=Cichorium intybus TaxID=13427 RepID=A0ACB9E3M7_CICIN|nr:hypothetical protein L2E82_25372 [Cichorium intybus]